MNETRLFEQRRKVDQEMKDIYLSTKNKNNHNMDLTQCCRALFIWDTNKCSKCCKQALPIRPEEWGNKPSFFMRLLNKIKELIK